MRSMFVPVVFSLINKPTNGSFHDIVVLLRRFTIDDNPVGGFSFADKQTSRHNLLVNASVSDVFKIQTRLGGDQLLDFT